MISTGLLLLLASFCLGASPAVFFPIKDQLLFVAGFTSLVLLLSLWRVSANAKTSLEEEEELAREVLDEADRVGLGRIER